MPLLKKSTLLFDLAHGEMLDISKSEFSEFSDLLKSFGVKIKTNEHSDLTKNILSNIDILIIGNPIDNYFSNLEINDIVDFVREGGGLILISEYGADFLQRTNLNDIAGKFFNMYFEKNIVKEDNEINHNCSSILSILNFQDHKITRQLREAVLGGTCSILLQKDAKGLLYSNEHVWTEIFNNSTNQWLKKEEGRKKVVIAYNEHGKGKVVTIGDIDIFTNEPNIGINKLDNRKLIISILNWVIEPIKESEVLFWILDQVGGLQNVVKKMNTKINNIIETITFLENRITKIERNRISNIKTKFEKKSTSREESSFIKS